MSDASWLSIVGPNSGQGDGSIEYSAGANADPVTRRATVTLNDRSAEITQAAGTCLIRFREPSAGFPQSGGSGTVEVIASSQMCTWTASTDASWISLTSSANGKGSASVGFTVSPTSGPPRTGTIRVADQQFSVTQSEGCSYAISPVEQAVSASGADTTVSVATSPGCPWTALSNAPWITVREGASGSGPGPVRILVAPTEGPARTGTLVIAGRTFTVRQSPGCSFEVEPLAHSIPGAGGTGTVTITAAPGCSWSASSSVSWITLTGTSSGSGNGTVSFLVAQSTDSARSASITVAGRTVTVNQAQGCTFAIAPESSSVPAGGGTGTVDVTAATTCAWTAASNADWITVTLGVSGSGNGVVQFSVAATAGAARSGTLTIAGRTFTVNQTGGCPAVLNPQSTSVPAAGASREFEVQVAAGCAWTAASNVPWVAVSSGATGTGSGIVRIEVEPNPASARTGTVVAAGQTFTVTQESGCAVALSAAGQTVPSAGGTGTVGVSAAAGCVWTAVSSQPWITIASGASGSGDGSVTFSVAANTGPERTGTLNIGGQTFTIIQTAGCSFGIAPQQQTVAASGGSISVAVTAATGCNWTSVSQVSWIGVSAGASGSGNGSVQLAVQANTSAARQGTVIIAGQTFTVDQVSGCTYSIAPSARSTGAGGGSASFNVSTSSSNCPWTPVSSVPWIVVDTPTGIGNGKVDYTVQPNTSPGARSGTITLQGQVFTITQSGV